MRKQLIALAFLPTIAFAISDEEFFEIQSAQRQGEASNRKSAVTEDLMNKTLPRQTNNGDEKAYEDRRGSFNKGLAHLDNGFPNVDAFNSLVKALSEGNPTGFDSILIGQGIFKLVNPQGSLMFSLPGYDSWINAIPPAPGFSSAQAAGEMVELYWTSLIRDVPFNQFGADATVGMAVSNLSSLAAFKGPKVGGVVTRDTFLRGNAPGELDGPYVSQFLFCDVPYGAATVPAKISVPDAGQQFMTNMTDWLQVETGGPAAGVLNIDTTARYIRTPRDLSEYVHKDTPGQAALSALLIMMDMDPVPFDKSNPYLDNPTQRGFVTFDVAHILDLVRTATQEALKAAWYHKWQVNRRLRPEEYGFYLHQQLAHAIPMGIHPDLTGSPAVAQVFGSNGTYFLPQAYPEGSPVHPSYPAGHATFIGAAVTVLKAFFNETALFPNPKQLNVANTALEAFPGALTIGGELNKLASNISLGRDHAGVHYRTDGWQGMLLGEKVAIDVLNNMGYLFNEDFAGFSLTKFDGTTITVGATKKP